ncbi:hypothetical protein S58_08490 [Bradyrhizobium oligotrophicum S58]|uniref:Methyltransferase type 11 domain-containing protein n=1 Tax=Bradyrhizobium oligotrophicum S58 TaxID=1245469 RepID=M4ZKR4_9BRAD|nr:methyltransferase domain-containing protein [Bradyrhizobium oligotrophicum]BAM86860.1 hypothetical protein S58_08490 [Bradyrhizobium oligotrophicum S58]
MLRRATRYLKRLIAPRLVNVAARSRKPVAESAIVSQQGLLDRLSQIPYWEDKIRTYKQYTYEPDSGAWTKAGSRAAPRKIIEGSDLKVNYGCGSTILDDWINIDLFEHDHPAYYQVNLLDKHPFADNTVRFGYSEDMLEHLPQAASIFVVAEIYRTLKPGGVMRFSFPGLEGVLHRHYSPATETRIREGEFEAYAFWDQIHFYAKEELRLVAEHIGFRKVSFFTYGISDHAELQGRDTRAHQVDLNTFAELTK